MSAKSFGAYTETFYKKHQEYLQRTYPGLSMRRLRGELEQFSTQNQLNNNELFDFIYVPSLHNPFTIFFERLKEGWPLEYIRGRAHFYRSEFTVTPDVLIPRSETEILVEKATFEINKWVKKTDERIKICDIGTGTGAIVISLLQDCSSPVEAVATDISRSALKVAKRNYFNLRYTIPRESSLRLLQTDRMKDLDSKFHLIVSNPPYIKESEDRSDVHSQVDQYEPHLALYLKDEEYNEWFKTLFTQVKNSLYEDGVFLMEGHEEHLQYLAIMMKNLGFEDPEVLQDYTGRDRFIFAKV